MNNEEINIETISWSAPEHIHKERTIDWYWTVGLITIVAVGVAIWTKNYVFAIFILVSGASLGLVSIRHPKEINFTIENKGLTIGRDFYDWSRIKGFDVKKNQHGKIILVEINKYFLPVYTIHIPEELAGEIKDSLSLIIPRIPLNESHSVLFMEKLGF